MTKNAGFDTIVMPGGHPDRTKTKGRDGRQKNEPDAKRSPRSWQYCRRSAEGKHRAKNSNVKGMNKLKFVFRCAIVCAVIMAGFLLSALIR